MKEKSLKQAEHGYSPGQRLAALLVEAAFFLVVFPAALIILASSLDRWLHLPRLLHGSLGAVLGGLLVVAGFLFAVWSVYVQFTVGRGTPAPVMPTQRLVVQGPYGYCRNPMALGTIVLYLGVAILSGSLSAVGLVALGAAVLLTYIRLVEEREMEARFGQEYWEYRRRTPFLIPRFRERG
ncbi:MAG: isoprenylcysteine carboxylmethyltransferase family protein [Chloroflexi bacterium]|nr:isoprenylcysteine carboxylmethyltransferase family protein [Chloroflexota bacterium]